MRMATDTFALPGYPLLRRCQEISVGMLCLLRIHGVVVKKDGTTVELNIGENEDDPVFFISDLLIHLAAEQMEKKAAKVIEGEALDLSSEAGPYTYRRRKKEKRRRVVRRQNDQGGSLYSEGMPFGGGGFPFRRAGSCTGRQGKRSGPGPQHDA